ncbi:hypothetical protein PI125_g16693 [Phytophthora idaei]|nr:hypothetical protein PI125_g16693 [Phytophthora idaei]
MQNQHNDPFDSYELAREWNRETSDDTAEISPCVRMLQRLIILHTRIASLQLRSCQYNRV